MAAPRKNPSTALTTLGDCIDSLQAAVSAEFTALISAYDKLSDSLNALAAETTPPKQVASARPSVVPAGRRNTLEPDDDDEPAPARRGRPPVSTGRRPAPQADDDDDDIDDPPAPRRGRPPGSGNKTSAPTATPARRGRPPAVSEPEEEEDDFDAGFDEPEDTESDGGDDDWESEWVEEPAKPARRGR